MSLPRAIICDIDGTLALLAGRNPYVPSLDDPVNFPVADVLHVYRQIDPKVSVFLVSGREDIYKDLTCEWLNKNNIPFDSLFMRSSGDFRKDYVIKKEVYQHHIYNKFEVLFVFDDRNQTVSMWRDIGLTCFQVAPGDF